MNRVSRLLEQYNDKIEKKQKLKRMLRICNGLIVFFTIILIALIVQSYCKLYYDYNLYYNLLKLFTQENFDIYSRLVDIEKFRVDVFNLFMIRLLQWMISFLFVSTLIILFLEFTLYFIVNNKECFKKNGTRMQIVLFFIEVDILVGAWCFRDYFHNTNCLMKIEIVLFISMVILYSIIYHRLKIFIRREEVNLRSDTDEERLRTLKNLLEEEKICFDDIEKIQVLIDELIRMKDKKNIFADISRFVVKPIIVIAMPWAIAFFTIVMEGKPILFTMKIFFVIILGLIVSLPMLFPSIIYSARYLIYGKYDALIDDLRLLQITKEEKENQSIRCMVFIHKIENPIFVRDNPQDSHSS